MRASTRNIPRKPLYLALVALLASNSPVIAQETEKNNSSKSYSMLEEVVVTAQRREQSLQDAPVAVTALPASQLDQFNVTDAQDLMAVVPGLQVSTQSAGDGGGSATFFLRGMGQQRAGNGSEPAIGIYVDDFYYPSLSGNNFDVVDVAQIEVLRGPQGTLFGRNTIGGAIRYTTEKAAIGESSGYIKGKIGNYDNLNLSGATNIAISDNAAVRLTAGHLEQDGYVKVKSTGEYSGATETDLVRLQAVIQPTTSIHADFSAQWSKSQLDGFTYNVPGPVTPIPPGPGHGVTLPFVWNVAVAPAINAPFYTDQFASECFYCQFGTANPEFSETTNKNAFATIGWEMDNNWSLKSLTGWQSVENAYSVDLDSTPLPIFYGGSFNNETKAFSQEFQLNGQAFNDKLNFVSGLFYYNETQDEGNPDRLNDILGMNPPILQLSERELDSYAAYIDTSFDVTDRLSLLLGYRFSQDDKQAKETSTIDGSMVANSEESFSSSTYRAGVQYSWNDDVMTYANIATGFRAGGFNDYDPNQTPVLLPFEQEESTSYEIGARLQFLDGRLTVNPTLFFVDWDDIQVQEVIPTSSGDVLIFLQNAGKAESTGFELEWAAQLTDSFRLFGDIALLDIKYTDIGTATGITTDSNFQRAPEVTYSVGGMYQWILQDASSLTATVNYSFQDEQYSTPTDANALLLDDYALLNARVEYTTPSGDWTIALYGSNLTDEEYYVGGVNFYADVGAARYDVGRPLEYGVTVKFEL